MNRNNESFPLPKLILLDVYETLVDMSDLERKVNNLLGSKRGYLLWFELLMQYCLVDNSIEQFDPFTSIAKATMKMAGQKLDKEVRDDDIEDALEWMKHLPLHESVQEGLSLLHDQGFRLAALTNSPDHIIQERMERTGLISYFEAVLSAEQIKKYKPSLEVYYWASQKLQVPVQEILFVSAHSWDLAGAANSGMQTAYIQQKMDCLYSLVPQPHYKARDLVDLANQLQTVVH
jgi:2-haloacid dehalogenase